MQKKLFLLSLAAVLALEAGAGLSEDRPTVRIGLIVPLTGSLGEAGAAFRDAARLALEEKSPQNRMRYELIVEDDELKPAKAVSAAHKLINIDHVDAIISTWSYGGTAVSPLAERAKVIHFGIAWDPQVAEGRYNFVHLTPPSEFLPKFLEIFGRKGYRRIAAIGMIESGSVYCMDELQRMIKGQPFTVVERATLNYGEFDFRSILMRAEGRHPDIYFTNLGTIENDLLMKQAQELGIKTPITSITGFDVSEDLARLEGRWYVSDSIMPDEVAARFGHRRLYGVGNYYDSVKLIIDRFERLTLKEKPRREDLPASFERLNDFKSIFGPLSIDHQGIISYSSRCRIIKNGIRHTVPCAIL